MKRWLTILMLFSATAAMATVDLTLFNTFPLLDNMATPLEGLSTSGDLVQLILVGPNGVIDPPSISGGASGDDALLFTSHVGAGLTTTNSGQLVQSSILYADAFGGNSNAFVRFWDSNTAVNADYYGTSAVFTLPSGDGFGLAEYDFAPAASFSANVPFGAQAAAVPEPSNLFLLGMLVMGCWMFRHRRLTGRWLAIAGLLVCADSARAQISLPLDVTASQSIVDTNSIVLTGDNPANGGGTLRCLVQILQVGDGGVSHLPDLSGSPTSNDQIVAETVIGQGMPLALSSSGRFSTSIYAPPATLDGHRLYARVFNAPSASNATFWAQSATFVVTNATVMDVSALGISATTQPKASDPMTTDSDGDGQTNYQELLANTNPLDASDRLDVSAFVAANVKIAGHAGRQYTLQRSTDELTGAMTWTNIAGTGLLNADQDLTLTDPNPPATSKAFYRLKVTMP